MAQPRPSTPPAQEHSQIGRGQPPASTSDTASILSAGDYSDTYDSYYQDRDRDKASRTPNTTRAKGKRSMPSPRSASLAPTTIGRASKFKTRASASRAPSLDSEGEPDDADTRGRGGNRERAMSPGLPLFAARGASVVFDEDDEVLRRDRGEELVRKRMRDRARLKKVSIPLHSSRIGSRNPLLRRFIRNSKRRLESGIKRTVFRVTPRCRFLLVGRPTNPAVPRCQTRTTLSGSTTAPSR